MAKQLICALACNKYPSSPLSGCVDDAEALISLCRDYGWEGPVRFQTDDQVTNNDIRQALTWFVEEVNTGEYTNAFMVVSGHGTSIPAPGRQDPTREIFCPVDIDYLWQSRELMSDEDYEAILNKLKPELRGKVKVDFMALCCHSGGLTTTQIDDAAVKVMQDPSVRMRYLRNPWEPQIAAWRREQPAVTKVFNLIQPHIYADDASVWAFHSAAMSSQYSFEVNSPMYGRGDVSRLGMCQAIKSNSSITLRALHQERVSFISRTYQFDQTPLLWAPTWRLEQDFFSPPAVG